MTQVQQRINRSRYIRYLLLVGIVAITTAAIIYLTRPPEIGFKDFPVRELQTINFDISSGTFSRLTEREQKDQSLDWLIYTIASDRDFTTDRINETFYDLPTMRHDYMKPVANFEYGEIRQINLDRNVVALIPRNQENRIENIAYITDSYRKNTGKIPETVQIFEYELKPDGKSADLIHTSNISGKEFYTDKYGYYEERIDNLADLKKFTAEVSDVTFSRFQDTKLVLGGRKISNRPTQSMTVEDIAALWQSRKAIIDRPKQYPNINGSGFSLDWDYDYKGLADDLEKSRSFLADFKLNGKAIITDGEKKDTSSIDISPYFRLIKKLRENRSAVFDSRDQALEIKQEKLESKELELDNQQAVFNKKLEDYNAKEYAAQDRDSSLDVESIVLKQEKEKLTASQNLIDKEREEIEAQKSKYYLLADSQIVRGFQFARYDGTLKGTEVGMTLFYTDLIAKLWGNDHATSIPTKQIPDFLAETDIASKISSIYRAESEKNSYTRLWFSPQEKGYQQADINNEVSLIFTSNATKINAKSSGLAASHSEAVAVPSSQVFINWWDRHYDEVARYEPQYQKLNQIMKWSIIIEWLNGTTEDGTLTEHAKSLDFLAKEKVNHENWFPDWVQTHNQELKFQLWDNRPDCKNFKNDGENHICFYGRKSHNHETETLPLLRSKYFKEFGTDGHYFYGGVSLADRLSISELSTLTEDTQIIKSGLRSNIDYKLVKPETNGFSFKTRAGVTYKITQEAKASKVLASTTIQAAKEMKLRSSVIEVANNPTNQLKFTSNVTHTSDGIQISTTAKDIPVQDFSTTKTPNGFTISFKSRDIDAGQSLALDLSKSPAPEVRLSNDLNVISAYKEGSVYYIETKDSTHVLKLTPDGGGSGKGGGGNGGGKPPENWVIHAGSAGGGNGGGGEPPQNPKIAGSTGDSGGSNSNYYGSWEKKKKGYKEGKEKIVDRLAADIIAGAKTPTELLRNAVDRVKKGTLKVHELVLDSSKSEWSEQPADFLKEVGGMFNGKNKFKVIEKDDAFVYVQDSPGLNNHDWNAPFEPAFTSSGRSKQRVYQLTGKGLSDFGYDPKKLNPASSPPDYQVSKGSFSKSPMLIAGRGSDDNCEDGIADKGTCRKVYVVIEAKE
jgi:hypothetical protein